MIHFRNGRAAVLRATLAAVLLGAAVFASPIAVRSAYASGPEPTCSVQCKNGSCAGYKSYCTCTCHWFFSTPVCSCIQPMEDPSAPAEPSEP